MLQLFKRIINNWKRKFKKKDRFAGIIKKNGFHIKYSGRAGNIYYVENGQIGLISFEMSDSKETDLIIYFEDSLRQWLVPINKIISHKEKAEIKEKLTLWLKNTKIKAEL